jgi:putative ABC transport system permease protein
MLWNDLKSVFRSLRRHVGYTAINVAGLAVGIAACLLIALYINHEVSHDDFHEDAERIHRIVGDFGETAMPAIQWPAIAEIRRKNPSLTVASFFQSDAVVGRNERRFNEDRLFVAQPSFFDVFTFPVQRGTAKETFDQPYTAVLTPEKARQYFGDQNPVGKTLGITGFPFQRDTTVKATVTGVLEPIPDASHFHPEVIVSWATLDAAVNFTERKRDSWSGGVFRAYLKVPEETSPSALAETFTKQIRERAGDRFKQGFNLRLQPLTDIHLYSDLSLELEPNGSVAYVWVFGFVALAILILAGVNFVNLALARSVERTREVGIRKSIGATRGQIARQFLAEGLLLVGAAAALAVGLAASALPVFRSITVMEVTVGALAEPFAVATLLGTGLVVAFGAAAYPAFVLSRRHPARVLGGGSKGHSGNGGPGGSRLRRGLVVFQFVVAVALGAGTIAAYWQLNYLQEADLGFSAEQLVTLPMPPTARSSPARARAFKQEATRRSGVRAVSKASESVPANLSRNAEFAFANTNRSSENLHNLRLVTVGPDFFRAMGIDVAAGRVFAPGRVADTSAVVVNQAGFQQLAQDLPSGGRSASAAVGRSLQSSAFWLTERPTLIGVVKNAHLSPLYNSIPPTAFLLTPSSLNDTYYLRIDRDSVDQALHQVESVWQELFPKAPFAYEFANRALAEAYRAEQRISILISVFAGLALAIACLGLFGLAAVAVRQRRREIGIRKAVGASAGQIVALFSKDFARLVGIAIVVAVPPAYIGLSWWLGTFAYHIDLGPSVFLIAGGGALGAALLAVSVQAVRAARTDPATVLRTE